MQQPDSKLFHAVAQADVEAFRKNWRHPFEAKARQHQVRMGTRLMRVSLVEIACLVALQPFGTRITRDVLEHILPPILTAAPDLGRIGEAGCSDALWPFMTWLLANSPALRSTGSVPALCYPAAMMKKIVGAQSPEQFLAARASDIRNLLPSVQKDVLAAFTGVWALDRLREWTVQCGMSRQAARQVRREWFTLLGSLSAASTQPIFDYADELRAAAPASLRAGRTVAADDAAGWLFWLSRLPPSAQRPSHHAITDKVLAWLSHAGMKHAAALRPAMRAMAKSNQAAAQFCAAWLTAADLNQDLRQSITAGPSPPARVVPGM